MLKLLLSINDRINNPNFLSDISSAADDAEGLDKMATIDEFTKFEDSLHDSSVYNTVVSSYYLSTV